MNARRKLRVAVNGYGVIGKHVADVSLGIGWRVAIPHTEPGVRRQPIFSHGDLT